MGLAIHSKLSTHMKKVYWGKVYNHCAGDIPYNKQNLILILLTGHLWRAHQSEKTIRWHTSKTMMGKPIFGNIR